MSDITTIPLPPHDVAAIALALGLVALSAVIYGVLSLMGNEREEPQWAGLSAGWLAILIPLALVWVALFWLTLMAVLSGAYSMLVDPKQATLGLGGLIAALLGAPFLIWGTTLKHLTYSLEKEKAALDRETSYANRIAEVGDRLGAEKTVYSKGTQLTQPDIQRRIAAIAWLERFAQDSTRYDNGRDHVRVMEILCAYIRENAPALDLTPTMPPFQRASPRVDIQTALDVIKRRSDEQVLIEEKARYRLDLRKTNLDGCNLRKGKFAGALFWHSRFEAADLAMSDLSGAQLKGSLLNFAEFWKAKLRGTNLDRCVFNKPDPGVFNVGFLGGEVEGVSVVAADLSSLSHLGSAAKKVFGSKDTKLHGSLELVRHDLSDLNNELRAAKNEENTSEISRIEKEIEENPLSHWFEFDSQDLALNHFRSEFFTKLGISGWPVEDR